ncbi:BTB/POZ protein, partial [Rhizophagus irregularis DAOM 181602=DAOM 197198]
MSYEYYQEVVDDFEKLLTTEIGYDVIIYAGENESMKELYAHSNILCTRSQYFRTAFSNKWAEKNDGKFIFKKPNVSPEFFKVILRFIYCGKIDLTRLQGPEVLKLLIVVDELNIQSLISCIQNHLI